jgi:hypothetical protein
MVLDLENFDATIVQFDTDFRVQSEAFRPPKDGDSAVQMSWIILSILRRAAAPLTACDLALELLIERALDNYLRLLRLMTKTVGVALRGQRENSVVRCD